jgi:hypothetical protein
MILTSAWSEPSRSAAPSAKAGSSNITAVKGAPADAGVTSSVAADIAAAFDNMQAAIENQFAKLVAQCRDQIPALQARLKGVCPSDAVRCPGRECITTQIKALEKQVDDLQKQEQQILAALQAQKIKALSQGQVNLEALNRFLNSLWAQVPQLASVDAGTAIVQR